MAVWPMPSFAGIAPTISSEFGAIRGDREHQGVDILYPRPTRGAEDLPDYARRYFVPAGTVAIAVADGVVAKSGPIASGGRVELDHGDGWRTQYLHLFGSLPPVGAHVRGGHALGQVGYNLAGYRLRHLHFAVLKGGAYVDPAPILAPLPVLSEPIEGPGALSWLVVSAGVLVASAGALAVVRR